MSFTYDLDLTAAKDQLRLLILDTVDTGHYLEDEEIAFIATQEPSLYRAAATLCRSIAAKVLTYPGYQDNIEWSPEDKAREYRLLAESFDDKAKQIGGASISGAAMLANVKGVYGEEQGDPSFTRDLHLNESGNDQA